MISPDVVFRYFLGILEPNQFGWALIVQPEFIEYARGLTFWITSPEKDSELINQQYYVPAGTIMGHEISRRSLIAITEV